MLVVSILPPISKKKSRWRDIGGDTSVPFIVREMSDEEAVIELVDANIQREDVLPSEKAWAYRLKLEAVKRQGARTDLTSPQVAAKFRSDDDIANSMGISGDTLRRYTRLTELIPELLDMVDEKKIALTPASELSFLKKEEQTLLLDAMDSEQATPSLSQAQRLKKFSQEGTLSIDVMRAIMSEEKKGELDKITLTGDKLRKYSPRAISRSRWRPPSSSCWRVGTKSGSNRLDRQPFSFSNPY
jgi:ParB family chromosome partitioning protein